MYAPYYSGIFLLHLTSQLVAIVAGVAVGAAAYVTYDGRIVVKFNTILLKL